MVGYGHDSDAFLRSTVVRVLDEERKRYTEGYFPSACSVDAERHAAMRALDAIRSRFTEEK